MFPFLEAAVSSARASVQSFRIPSPLKYICARKTPAGELPLFTAACSNRVAEVVSRWPSGARKYSSAASNSDSPPSCLEGLVAAGAAARGLGRRICNDAQVAFSANIADRFLQEVSCQIAAERARPGIDPVKEHRPAVGKQAMRDTGAIESRYHRGLPAYISRNILS